jgi:hypothetical protein
MVRIRAVESLGFLKLRADAIEQATKDRNLAVRWAANLAAGQIKSDIDRKGILSYAAQPTFSTPTSYVDDIDLMLDALKKAAR